MSKGDHVFLMQSDGAFKARLFVSPDIDLRARVGQEVVLEGYLDRAPRQAPVQWSRTRVVTDTSHLQPSTLPQSGLVRAEVALDQVRAPAGRGLAEDELSAVLLENRARPGSSARVGNWQTLSATALSPWARDARIGGVYVQSSFHGSIALGGVHRRTSIVLGEDGRFRTSRFAQGGSGAMAAADGFSGNASAHSDARGNRSSAGGGTAGAFAGAASRRDDGAEQRGTYRLEGYQVELRYDSGRIERGFSFPWGEDRRMVYWLDGLYLRDAGTR